MCGIVGIFSHDNVASELYDSLINLQHRGQDAAGMVTYNERFHVKRGLGLVADVFRKEAMVRLQGSIGIGQTRYRTSGDLHVENTPPFWLASPYGIALSHNGTLTNCRVLRKELRESDCHHLNSSNDTEIILHIFAHALSKTVKGDKLENDAFHVFSSSLRKEKLEGDDFFELICKAVSEVFERVEGAYSCVCIIASRGMVVFRDPKGLRPLVWGKRLSEFGTEYIFASENSMFYSLDFEFMGDVQAGQVIFVDNNGVLRSRILKKEKRRSCIFEYVYFARPDAVLDGISVYRSRLYMGENLAKKWKRLYPDLLPDIVIPAPFTANSAALSMAHSLGIRYSEGLYKNPFIGRTFIMQSPTQRKKSVHYKLSPLESEIRDKCVMIVDDSIVRGTTSRELVRIIRDFGAKEVYFVSACPPIKSPCYYGIDIPTKKELVASHNIESEVRKFIGADILMYQDLDELIDAVNKKNKLGGNSFCTACMNGDYPVGNITEQKMKDLADENGCNI